MQEQVEDVLAFTTSQMNKKYWESAVLPSQEEPQKGREDLPGLSHLSEKGQLKGILRHPFIPLLPA